MVLWWIANIVALLVVVPLLLVLAARVLRVALEIARYSEDILEHGVGITAALDPLPALAETNDLASRARDNAVAYLTALQR
jgi:integral membrane sensor domain MASE1